MKDNVELFRGITKLPINPQRILENAAKHEFERILIIGVTKDCDNGVPDYMCLSDPDGGTALWDMECARHRLMKVIDHD